jgi:predicted nucleotidyltransferase
VTPCSAANEGDHNGHARGLPEAIQRFVAKLVRRFAPERVILFGSHARGTATAGSDVDLLVEMAFEGRGCDQAARIDSALERDFPLDLIVRRPEAVRAAVDQGDPFMTEIVEQGRVLYARGE